MATAATLPKEPSAQEREVTTSPTGATVVDPLRLLGSERVKKLYETMQDAFVRGTLLEIGEQLRPSFAAAEILQSANQAAGGRLAELQKLQESAKAKILDPTTATRLKDLMDAHEANARSFGELTRLSARLEDVLKLTRDR